MALRQRDGKETRLTLVLTQSEVRSLMNMSLAVPAIEKAFVAHGQDQTQMPVKVYLDLPRYHGDFRAMPAYFDGSAGVKWVNSHPRNPEKHGLPAVLGMYILSDPETAQPLAVLDATFLTAARTGAAAAVAAKYLARDDARTVGFVGSGVQARTMLSALQVVFPELEVFASDRKQDAAVAFAEEVSGQAVSVEHASGCDIVCCATPSRTPVVRRDWVKPGAHINAMGADAPGKQELEAAILLEGKVVVDDYEQAGHSGEVNVPLEQGVLEPEAIHGTLGTICAGFKPGRETAQEITVFDSTGLAVQDVALARMVVEQARKQGIGTEVDFLA